MTSIKAQGFSALEIISVLVVLALVAALVYYKTIDGVNHQTRARAALNHIKLMGTLIETQKRALGDYPRTLKAMRDKTAYLAPGGNQAGYTTEAELRTPWDGPYLTQHQPYPDPNYLPDVVYKINLDDIFPGMEGELGALFEAPKILAYVLTSENAASGLDAFSTFAYAVIKKCNNVTTVTIPPRPRALSHSYVSPSPTQPCGYAALGDKIEYLTYYLHQYP